MSTAPRCPGLVEKLCLILGVHVTGKYLCNTDEHADASTDPGCNASMPRLDLRSSGCSDRQAKNSQVIKNGRERARERERELRFVILMYIRFKVPIPQPLQQLRKRFTYILIFLTVPQSCLITTSVWMNPRARCLPRSISKGEITSGPLNYTHGRLSQSKVWGLLRGGFGRLFLDGLCRAAPNGCHLRVSDAPLA